MIKNTVDLQKSSYVSFQTTTDWLHRDLDMPYADGRMINGILRTGDVFDTLCCYIFTDGLTKGDNSIEVLHEEKISIKVQKICFYGHYVDEIDAGVTGRVFFTGDLDESELAKHPKAWINLSIVRENRGNCAED